MSRYLSRKTQLQLKEGDIQQQGTMRILDPTSPDPFMTRQLESMGNHEAAVYGDFSVCDMLCAQHVLLGWTSVVQLQLCLMLFSVSGTLIRFRGLNTLAPIPELAGC